MTVAAEPQVPAQPTASPRAGVRRAVLIVGVLAILGVGMVAGWRWYRDRSYIGTTRAVTIEWRCLNRFEWHDDERNATWHATAPIAIRPLTTDGRAFPPSVRVTGTIRFDTYDVATFTSDTGGTTELRRLPPSQFTILACVLR